MALYLYPQVMYRSDGAMFTCNSDADVAGLFTPNGTCWAPMPWAPASYTGAQEATDYAAMLAQNEAQAAQILALEAQITSADQALTSGL
jgi:hypothetical protein